MSSTAYYLLLSSLASSALAACGDEPECPHTVVSKSKQRTVSAADACEYTSLVRGDDWAIVQYYGIDAERCPEVCADPAMNTCSLPSESLRDALGIPSRAVALSLIEALEAHVWSDARELAA